MVLFTIKASIKVLDPILQPIRVAVGVTQLLRMSKNYFNFHMKPTGTERYSAKTYLK